jgi:carbohydrate-binding DOMON domain-containing protein
MRLALLVLALFIVALAATTKKEGKRQINHYLPYYGTNNVIEPRQFRPTRTATVTQISTLTYTFT